MYVHTRKVCFKYIYGIHLHSPNLKLVQILFYKMLWIILSSNRYICIVNLLLFMLIFYLYAFVCICICTIDHTIHNILYNTLYISYFHIFSGYDEFYSPQLSMKSNEGFIIKWSSKGTLQRHLCMNVLILLIITSKINKNQVTSQQ